MNNANQLQKVGAGRTATIFRYGQQQVVKLYKPTFPDQGIQEEFQIGLYLNHLRLDAPQTNELVDLKNLKEFSLTTIQGRSMLQNLAGKPWMAFSYSKRIPLSD